MSELSYFLPISGVTTFVSNTVQLMFMPFKPINKQELRSLYNQNRPLLPNNLYCKCFCLPLVVGI